MRTISTIDQYAMTRNEVDFKRMNNISIPERQEEFLSSIEQHPKYNSILDTSGLIETKESDFGFPLLGGCATLPHAHRDYI